MTFFTFWLYPLVYNCTILHLASWRRNTKENKSQGLRGGVGIWSVSNFPQFLHFESRNAISNFRWRLSIVSVKSFNQFIVIYHSSLLLPTEAHYLSLYYKWRRRRQRRENKKKVEINTILVGRETAEHLLNWQGGTHGRWIILWGVNTYNNGRGVCVIRQLE